MKIEIEVKEFVCDRPKHAGEDICFICPETKDKWLVGWCDGFYINTYDDKSYSLNDPRLTSWYRLPLIAEHPLTKSKVVIYLGTQQAN